MADPPPPSTDDLARRLFSGTALNVAGALVGKPLDLILVAIAVHRLGGAAFGVAVIAQGIGLWPTLAEKGLGQTMIRLVAGDRREADYRSVFSSGLVLYGVLGLATLVLGIAGVHLLFLRVFDVPRDLRSEAVAAADLLLVAAAVRNLTGFVPRILVGRTRFLALRATELVRGGLALLLVLVLVGGGASAIVSFGWSMVISDVVASLLGLWYVRGDMADLSLRECTRPALRDHWTEAKPVLASGGIGLAWSRIDPVIIGVGLGPVAAATYGVAIRVYEMLQGMVELLYLGLLPATASLLDEGDGRRVGRLLIRANTYAAALAWPGCALIGVLAPEIIQLWIGRPVPQIWSTLVMTTALVAVTVVPSSLMYVIIGAGRVASVLRAQLVAVVVNLAVGIGALPFLGVGSVFLGTIAGTALVAVRSSAVVGELTGGSSRTGWAGIVRPFVLSVALGVALMALRATTLDGLELLAAAILPAALYAIATAAWVVPRGDLRHLRPAA